MTQAWLAVLMTEGCAAGSEAAVAAVAAVSFVSPRDALSLVCYSRTARDALASDEIWAATELVRRGVLWSDDAPLVAGAERLEDAPAGRTLFHEGLSFNEVDEEEYSRRVDPRVIEQLAKFRIRASLGGHRLPDVRLLHPPGYVDEDCWHAVFPLARRGEIARAWESDEGEGDFWDHHERTDGEGYFGLELVVDAVRLSDGVVLRLGAGFADYCSSRTLLWWDELVTSDPFCRVFAKLSAARRPTHRARSVFAKPNMHARNTLSFLLLESICNISRRRKRRSRRGGGGK